MVTEFRNGEQHNNFYCYLAFYLLVMMTRRDCQSARLFIRRSQVRIAAAAAAEEERLNHSRKMTIPLRILQVIT